MTSVSIELAVVDGQDPPEQQRGEIRLEAAAAAHHDDADGEEHGEQHGHRRVGVDAPAAGEHRQQQHRADPGDERAEQQRLPEGEGDGDAGEHGVLDDLGEERQSAQQHVHPDDAAEHAEQHHLQHGAAHERGAQRLDQQVLHRRSGAVSGRAAWRRRPGGPRCRTSP